jgi:DNA-binding PadR family transcriptional regulator
MKALKSAQVKDRDVKVFQITTSGTSNLKQYLMSLDQIEQERLRELKLTED